MSYEAYNWRGLIDKPKHSKVIHCTNTQEPAGIYINIEGSKEEILLSNTGKSSGKNTCVLCAYHITVVWSLIYSRVWNKYTP